MAKSFVQNPFLLFEVIRITHTHTRRQTGCYGRNRGGTSLADSAIDLPFTISYHIISQRQRVISVRCNTGAGGQTFNGGRKNTINFALTRFLFFVFF